MGRKTEEAAIVAEFARAHGCSDRTARNHRAKKTAEWHAFIAGRSFGCVDEVVCADVVRAKELVNHIATN